MQAPDRREMLSLCNHNLCIWLILQCSKKMGRVSPHAASMHVYRIAYTGRYLAMRARHSRRDVWSAPRTNDMRACGGGDSAVPRWRWMWKLSTKIFKLYVLLTQVTTHISQVTTLVRSTRIKMIVDRCVDQLCGVCICMDRCVQTAVWRRMGMT